MLISVCVKYVPDADAISRIDTGNFMVPKPEVMSFYDVHALSLALSLGGDVCIVSAGCKKDEEDCVTYLYKSLAMGVLDAVYVSGLDPIDSPQNTAFALSRGVLHLAGKYNKMPDIILCGAQSIGMANAEVPYRLASMLNLDIVPGISGLKTRKNMIQAKRQYDDMDEIIETKMPCLLMCEKNEITLPYPTLKNLMDAQEKEIPTLSAERKDVDITSPCLKSIHKCDPSRTCQMILGSSVEEKAINLLDALKKKGLILFENSKRKVGVFLDTQRDGKIKTSSFDLLNFVAQQKCEVFAFGSQTIKPGFLNTMGENGAQYFLDLGSAICVHESPDVYARTLASSIEKIDLDDFIAVAGQTGHDIVSRCAVLSNAPLLHNCVDVDLNNCVASKRIYAGMAHAEYAMPGPVNFYTVNPDILTRQKKFNFFPLAMDVAKSETKDSMEIISRTPIKHKNDILTAKTVFGGGLGFGSAAKFKEFQEATAQLNISVGATRSAVDAGYAPFSAQIGQTGHNISPDLYFAWGISGSIFHCAGFRGARVIVAINLDEQAQIFTKADFGIVEDMFKFFPALCDAIKNKTRV